MRWKRTNPGRSVQRLRRPTASSRGGFRRWRVFAAPRYPSRPRTQKFPLPGGVKVSMVTPRFPDNRRRQFAARNIDEIGARPAVGSRRNSRGRTPGTRKRKSGRKTSPADHHSTSGERRAASGVAGRRGPGRGAAGVPGSGRGKARPRRGRGQGPGWRPGGALRGEPRLGHRRQRLHRRLAAPAGREEGRAPGQGGAGETGLLGDGGHGPGPGRPGPGLANLHCPLRPEAG